MASNCLISMGSGGPARTGAAGCCACAVQKITNAAAAVRCRWSGSCMRNRKEKEVGKSGTGISELLKLLELGAAVLDRQGLGRRLASGSREKCRRRGLAFASVFRPATGGSAATVLLDQKRGL